MAKRPVTVNDILDGHVVLDLECLDRLYLNGYVPNLQVGGQVVNFLTHRGFPIPSPALLEKNGTRFRRQVERYAEANGIPVVRFAKGDRKLEVMRPHLDRLARAGRTGVAAIGVAQEFQRVFTGTTYRAEGGGAPHFSYAKADRRVIAYYFYLVDEAFGPAFVKICAYFPYPIKICLLTELRAELLQVTGQIRVRVATVPAHDRIRRALPGSHRVGGASVRSAAGEWGSVRALPAA
jgi:hypothetical protein